MDVTYSRSCFIALSLALLSFSIDAIAQQDADLFTAKNTVFVELGGNGGLISINYDRIFHQNGKFKFAGRAGFSYFKQSSGNKGSNIPPYWSPLLPLEVTALWGRSRHHLELGVGVTFFSSRNLIFNPEGPEFFERDIGLDMIIPIRLGYRYQKPEGGFFFRVGYTPGFNPQLSSKSPTIFTPLWGGISIGTSF